MGIERREGGDRDEWFRGERAPAAVSAAAAEGSAPAAGKSLSPRLLGYAVAPAALAVLILFRHFGLVAQLPVWSYVVAIGAPAVLSVMVEPWHAAPVASPKRQIRLAIHILAVTAAIYLTGWGPALGMAYAFVALEELEQGGSRLWRPVLWWTLLNILVAQYLVWFGLVPSFLSRGQAEAVGVLGGLVVAIVIRMAGATGEKKERAEELLAYQALHDMLTGLPNRAFFYERTEEALARTAAGGSGCAVMLFDLDRFKEINDTMGHRSGDRVLIEVGPRVLEVLRAGDTLARLGGDEFCVLLPTISEETDAVRVAERIIAVLEAPFEMDGASLGIEASCGISMAPADGETADLLLQRADVAMYVAKGSQASVVMYSEELNVNTPARMTLLGDLRNAVVREEFVLHYQPKAAMASRRVQGAEALVRWQHPIRGLLAPDTFIPEAERSGLIEPMTVWVLNEGLRECRRWLDDGPTLHDRLSIAVNLSARSLLDADLPATVGSALTRWKVPPHLLDLEITETIIMTDPERARRVLEELSQMGVTLSIDDFGTGYSSLAYLRDLPVRQLKIDRTFVQDMVSDADNAVIVRSVVDLARNLGLLTVAEGVENESTWQMLNELGCASAQGYFLAPPMPGDQFRVWLEEYEATSAMSAGRGGQGMTVTGSGLMAVRRP